MKESRETQRPPRSRRKVLRILSVLCVLGVVHPEATLSLLLYWPIGGAKYRINAHVRFAEHLAYVKQHGLDQTRANGGHGGNGSTRRSGGTEKRGNGEAGERGSGGTEGTEGTVVHGETEERRSGRTETPGADRVGPRSGRVVRRVATLVEHPAVSVRLR